METAGMRTGRFFVFEIGRWVGKLCYFANDAFILHDQHVTIQADFIDSVTDAMAKALFNVLQLSEYMKFTLQVCVREKILLNGKKYPVGASKVCYIISLHVMLSCRCSPLLIDFVISYV
jgi:hypothetical protein